MCFNLCILSGNIILKELPAGLKKMNSKICELLEIEFDRLENVLNNVSIEDKTVLLMKYQDDMSIRDISNIINKSESAVKMKIKRAKAKSMKVYHKLYPEDPNQ